MIDLFRVTVVLVRLAAITWFVEAVLQMTYLPPFIIRLSHGPSSLMAGAVEMDVKLLVLRLLIYIGMGVAFMTYSNPIALFLTGGPDMLDPSDDLFEVDRSIDPSPDRPPIEK